MQEGTIPAIIPGQFATYDSWLRGRELASGILRIDEAIREGTTSKWLQEISEIRRRQLPELTVVVTSPGGGAYYAFALYDALRDLSQSGTRIKMLVAGWAASAASMIVLQAGDERLAHAHARFLLHEAKRWVFFAVERTSDLEDEIAEMKSITQQIVSLLAKRCNKQVDEVERLIHRKEVWMSASEAKDWGLIDEIV